MREAERAERNLRIVLARMREVPVKTIAEQYEITERQVRRIMADWREGSLKDETDIAANHVKLILEQTRQDIEALQITSVDFDPQTRIKALGAQVEQAGRSIRVLQDAGVSFKDVFKGGRKDTERVSDVNQAVRYTLIDHGVDMEAIEAATEASVQTFGEWGYPVDI